MTKTQILIIVLPPILTIVAVVVGILVNNYRFGQIDGQLLGMRSQLRSRMDEHFDAMRKMVREDLRGFGDRIEARLKRLAER